MLKRQLWLLFFIFFACSALQASECSDCYTHHCMAVIDAGSSGSRLFIYQYDLNEKQFPVNIEPIVYHNITPGISTLNPHDLTLYLDRLMGTVPSTVIPTYFYATAGMRLLPREKQHEIYQAVKKWFSGHTTFDLRSARTISGQEEGVWGWLAVNYTHGGLIKTASDQYLGVMDMGGASVEITYPIEPSDQPSQGDEIQFALHGKVIRLVSHSFLGMGQDLAAASFAEEPDCFTQGYPLSKRPSFIGTGQWPVCAKKIEAFIEAHQVAKVVQPDLLKNKISSWYTTGALDNLMQQPALMKDGERRFMVADLLRRDPMIACETPWPTLVTTNPLNEYMGSMCLATTYYGILLTQGYGLLPKESVECPSVTKRSSWALGVLLLPTIPVPSQATVSQ